MQVNKENGYTVTVKGRKFWGTQLIKYILRVIFTSA